MYSAHNPQQQVARASVKLTLVKQELRARLVHMQDLARMLQSGMSSEYYEEGDEEVSTAWGCGGVVQAWRCWHRPLARCRLWQLA
jgi:hypothetical protein